MEFFQFPKLFSTNAQIRRKKSNFRDKPYWRLYNCEVRMRIEGGLFINERAAGFIAHPSEVHSKSICAIWRKYVGMCVYFIPLTVIVAYFFSFVIDIFVGFDCFLPENCRQTKSWYILVNTQKVWDSGDDFCLLLMENPQRCYAPPSSFSPGKHLFISPISIWQLTFLLPECPKIIKHLTLA